MSCWCDDLQPDVQSLGSPSGHDLLCRERYRRNESHGPLGCQECPLPIGQMCPTVADSTFIPAGGKLLLCFFQFVGPEQLISSLVQPHQQGDAVVGTAPPLLHRARKPSHFRFPVGLSHPHPRPAPCVLRVHHLSPDRSLGPSQGEPRGPLLLARDRVRDRVRDRLPRPHPRDGELLRAVALPCCPASTRRYASRGRPPSLRRLFGPLLLCSLACSVSVVPRSPRTSSRSARSSPRSWRRKISVWLPPKPRE